MPDRNNKPQVADAEEPDDDRRTGEEQAEINRENEPRA
jgi:hypothetical protein